MCVVYESVKRRVREGIGDTELVVPGGSGGTAEDVPAPLEKSVT
jgi:hypothetical protein